MALSKTRGAWSAWAAVAQNGVGEGAIIDVSLHRATRLFIQGFLDTGSAVAHTGTQIIVQPYAGADPTAVVDENWGDHLWWTELVGTCNPEPSTLDPAVVGTTIFTVASTTSYVVANVAMPWIALQDITLANSELLLLKSIVTNTSLTTQDGSTRQHANTAIFGNIAFSRATPWIKSDDIMGMRILVNNNYDSDGAIVNWRFAWTANLK